MASERREVFNELKNQLLENEKVTIRGFGTFRIVHKPARIARNPKTGAPVNVEPKDVVRFKTSKSFFRVDGEGDEDDE